MEKCYGGWNAVVTVKAGLKSEYTLNAYEDHNVLSIAGEQNMDTGSINTDELETVSSSEAAYDMYESDKAMNAEYSRDRLQNSAYVGLNLTVPLYSREVRLKRIMLENGHQAIQAYYDMLAKKEKSKALMRSAKRKIFTLLENCGYVAGNRVTGKG
jgi:hypothetical protein